MTFCDRRGNGGWTNPHFRIQQAAGLRTKVSNKELEQRECPALPTPARFQFLFMSFIAVNFELCNTANMDEAIQVELDKLTELIINAIPVEQIYLFGSYAYGTPHKYSDLDLYVVLKDDVPMRDLDAGLQIALAISRKKSMPVDIVAKKKRDFDSRLDDITLERIVNRDGIRIYG